MPRTPTTGLNTELTAIASQPGNLVRITLTNGVPRYLCSLDSGFTAGSIEWVKWGITLQGLGNNVSGATSGSMSIDDTSNLFWSYATTGLLMDAQVDIWEIYAGAPGEVEPTWHGRIGGIQKTEMTIECELIVDGSLLMSPRRRVQNIIPAIHLIAPGTRIVFGNESWIINRR